MIELAGAFCSDHPTRPLQPLHDYSAPTDVQGKLRQCLEAGHSYRDRHRCARCGRAIVVGGVRRPYRAVFCGVTCRVASHRATRAAARVT